MPTTRGLRHLLPFRHFPFHLYVKDCSFVRHSIEPIVRSRFYRILPPQLCQHPPATRGISSCTHLGWLKGGSISPTHPTNAVRVQHMRSPQPSYITSSPRYAQVPGSRYSRLDRRPQPLSSKSNAPSAEGSPAPSVTHENEVEDPPTGTGALAGDPGGTETSHRVGDSVAGSGSLSDGSGSLRNGSGSSMETSSAAGGAATQSSGDANLRVGGGEADAANEGEGDS